MSTSSRSKKYSELESRSPPLKKEVEVGIPVRFCCFFFKTVNSENSQVSVRSAEKSCKEIPISIKDSSETLTSTSMQELNPNQNEISINSEIRKFDAQEIIQTEYSSSPGSLNQRFTLNVESFAEEDEMSLEEVDHPDILNFFKRK
jgi:hypothetical protein